MHILWINKIADKDIFKTTQLELSKAMEKKGHNVTLIMAKSVGERKSAPNDIIYFPTLYPPFLSGVIFGLLSFFYIPYIIRKKKIDIIIVDGTSVMLPFIITLKLFKIPLIVDVRDLPEYQKKSISFNITFNLAKYITDAVTTITPELKEILIKNYGLKNKKIGIWSSGVSKEKFIESPVKNNFPERKDPKKLILMHHGAYKEPRGIKNLITSIGELDDSVKKMVELKIIGIPDEEQLDYLNLCEKVNAKDQIKILPKVDYDKIPTYIQSSDVGIIPLPPEKKCWEVSVPLKTLEYLAMGKPIIATTIPFHRRLFEKGECGVLINSNNPKIISEAITNLYNNRDKLESMGKIGKEIVKNNFTWDSIASELEGFIKTILMDYQNE